VTSPTRTHVRKLEELYAPGSNKIEELAAAGVASFLNRPRTRWHRVTKT